MRKIAVLFPGIGYTCDKPLLYYSAKLAAEKGYEIVRVPYGNFPPNVKGDAAKMYQCFVSAREQAEEILRGVDWAAYGDVVFFSKSVGTVMAMSYAAEHGIDARQVLFTPLVETFRFPVAAGETLPTEAGGPDAGDSRRTERPAGGENCAAESPAGDSRGARVIAFHGTGDPWAATEEIIRICEERNVPLYLTKKANHSLERGKAMKDLRTVKKVMRTVKEFL
jgi:phosphoglycolate phosphatase